MKRERSSLAGTPEASDLRQRAQERLLEPGRTGVPQGPDKDAARHTENPQRLLHELQVHQVELAIQNEQLEAARAWIEAALASYTELFDFAPVPYFTLNHAGMIAEVNLAGARLLGVERSRLLDKRLGGFVAKSDQLRFAACIKCVFAAQADTHCEVSLESQDGTRRTVEVRATPAANGDSCRAVLIDVSERSAHERHMTRLADVFTQAREGMFITDRAGIIVDVNHAFSAITGHAPAQMVGQHASRLRCDRHSSGLSEKIMRALAIEGSWSGEIWLRHRDGKALPMVEHISTMLDSSGMQNYVSRFSRAEIDFPPVDSGATVH